MKDFLAPILYFILFLWLIQIVFILLMSSRRRNDEPRESYYNETLGTIDVIEETEDGLVVRGHLNERGIETLKDHESFSSSIRFHTSKLENMTVVSFGPVMYPINPEWKIVEENNIPCTCNSAVVIIGDPESSRWVHHPACRLAGTNETPDWVKPEGEHHWIT